MWIRWIRIHIKIPDPKKVTKTGEMFSITYEAIEPVFPSIVVPCQVHCVRYILGGILGKKQMTLRFYRAIAT